VARAALNHPNADAAQWMFVWVVEMLQDYPDEAWPVLLALIAVARDAWDLAVVGSGPLQEVLVAHGAHVIDRVEKYAGQDPRFRRALWSVGPSDISESVWTRVVSARGDEPGREA